MRTDPRYPTNWPAIATNIKKKARWRCQACGVRHGPPPNVLTVDHLNYDKANSLPTNLIALCQRCHLRRQALYPQPKTKEEAIRRLHERHVRETTAPRLFDLPGSSTSPHDLP